MRIAVVGGGPGGLYFAALTRQLGPGHEITVWERNAPDDTFGFGVVFSDETLGGIEHADPGIYRAMEREFARWDDIDVHFKGETITSGGHGFAAMSRRRLLAILQQRCADLGVRLHFRTEAPDVTRLAAGYDLVIAADGANSAVRAQFADAFRPDTEIRHCKYMWLGTDLVFDAFKFYIEQTPHGVMQIHGYPYDATGSTFIVEMHDSVWRAAGFGRLAPQALPPGASDDASIARIPEMFAPILGGHAVHANNSKWISFGTLRCQSWRHDNVILLGDAAHTAHFSIGSGTKLAMEDALALAACLHEQPSVDDALTAYEAERRPVVASAQRAAQASLEWFENLGQYAHQEPEQFAFNIITRSRRVTYGNLQLRDPEFVARVDAWFAGHASGAAWPRRRAAADVPAAPAARPGAGQPGRGLRHGHVLGHRRPAVRLPPGPPGRQGAGRGRAGDDRDGVRVPGGEDLARVRRAVHGRAGGGLAADHRVRARLVGGQDRPPARPLGPQGIDQADVGGDRPAAGVGQLAGVRALAAALPARREPGARGAVAGRAGVDQGAVRGRHPGGGALRLRPGRAALRARVPAVVVHLAAHQPPVR